MATFSFAGSLLAVALVLGIYEWMQWRSILRGDFDEDFVTVSRTQFRRRMWVSGIIILVAVMMAVGQWAPRNVAGLMYWGAVIALTCSVIGLAVADFRASRRFLARVKENHQEEYNSLMKEIADFKESQNQASGQPHENGAAKS